MSEKVVVLTLFAMIFFHIMDDFVLQRDLALYKQKQWWKENYPEKLYENDYITALLIHSFSWTFMIHIPVVLFTYNNLNIAYFAMSFFINAVIHAITDDIKANKRKISLTADQLIHLLQITLTWLALVVLVVL